MLLASVIVLLVHTSFGALLLPSIGEFDVTHATDAATVRRWLTTHCDGSEGAILGFDTETKPMFKKTNRPYPPSVVQLATADACLVAQIATSPPSIGEQEVRQVLAETLANRKILKVGVAIDDDAIDLWLHWGLEMYGRVELAGGRQPRGLARLTLEATGVTLPKSASVQKSNWAAPTLSEKQVAYAAADAWAGRAVLARLASIDEASFGYAAVHRRLSEGEKSCAALYALRRARQATRASLIAMDEELWEEGLPHWRGKDREEGVRLGRAASKKLTEARRRVAKALATPSVFATDWPVYETLDSLTPHSREMES